MNKTTTHSILKSKAEIATVIGFDFQSLFKDLSIRGETDVAIVSCEEGFSPLGGSGDFFERELGISYNDEIRPIARWNQDINEKITVIALASRNPNSSLLGVLLAPGENCRSYSSFASPYGRKPHRDYYYNISYEAIYYACYVWGARKLSISHLSASGRFHEDIATCNVEALSHFCDRWPKFAPESFTFTGCCINQNHLSGVHKIISEDLVVGHRHINVETESVGSAVFLHLNWDRL
jgi:hypothetical protein